MADNYTETVIPSKINGRETLDLYSHTYICTELDMQYVYIIVGAILYHIVHWFSVIKFKNWILGCMK